MKTIVVGVCGGIAAYKALDIVSGLKKWGHDVHVIMTKNAQEFVKPLSFQTISANEVSADMFMEPKTFDVKHISLAKKADLVVVVPATANVIGKVAYGIADDMLTTTIMATRAKVIFAPAMNTNMFLNPIVQNNINQLKQLGYDFIPPAHGLLACGDLGEGKLPQPADILSYIDKTLYDKKDLVGKHVLVTAGATKSLIDPVRYISNFSSGKMGYAIAQEAANRGAKVTLVSGETHLPPIAGVERIVVRTTQEMKEKVLAHFDESDIVVMSAAVLDYKVKQYKNEKMKKTADNITIELEKDDDILKELGKRKQKQLLVGFAAESNHVLEYAKEKILAKNLDYIVANDITIPDSGFNSEWNTVSVLSKAGDVVSLEKQSKVDIAKKMFDIFLNNDEK